MNETQIELVQLSFERIRPSSSLVSELFYGRLFEIDPSMRLLVRGNIQEQGRKLMELLGAAVAGLRMFGRLIDAVRTLGERNASYGVSDADYETVGAALIWALEQALGDAFTEDVREAWIEAYIVLATTMQSGAAGDAQQVA